MTNDRSADPWSRRAFTRIAGVVAAGTLLPACARATAPIRFIVGFPAGGLIDGIGRALAEAMRETMRADILVDNKAGASGRLAVRLVADAGVGRRMFLITPAILITIHPSTHRKLEYDPAKDLVPVGRAATFQLALVVPNNHPANTLSELRDWLKANTDTASFGTPGAGSGAHLVAAELLRRFDATEIPFVHYRGDAPQVLDIAGTMLPLGIAATAAVDKRRNRVKAIAVTGAERDLAFPDVPTLKESGIDLMLEEWVGVFAPRGTSDADVQVANRALGQALQSDAVRTAFDVLGVTPALSSPAEFARIIGADTARWRRSVEAIGFQAD